MSKLAKILLVSLSLILMSCSNNENKSSESKQTEQSGKKIRWKMASTFPGSLTQLGDNGNKVSRSNFKSIRGKNIQIKFFEPGALVPALEVFDAVSTGAVDAGWSTPGYWAGKVSALPLFAAVPFGPSAGEYMAWIYYGGGKELFEKFMLNII